MPHRNAKGQFVKGSGRRSGGHHSTSRTPHRSRPSRMGSRGAVGHRRAPGLGAMVTKAVRTVERVAVRLVPAAAIVGGSALIAAPAANELLYSSGTVIDRLQNMGTNMRGNLGMVAGGAGLIAAGIVGHKVIAGAHL